MQEQINNLQRQIDDLKAMLKNSSMPIELRETIRNEVIKEQIKETQTTNIYTINTLGDSVTVPAAFTNAIIIKWKGKEYKVPYYNV